MPISLTRFVLATVTALGLVGCGSPLSLKTYDGAQRPLTDVAVLSVDRQIYVRSVDGYQTGITFTTKDLPMAGIQLEITPGPHKFVFTFYSQSTRSEVGGPSYGYTISSVRSDPMEQAFDFKKGRKYELHYKRNEKNFNSEIVDVTEAGAARDYTVSWGQTRSK